MFYFNKRNTIEKALGFRNFSNGVNYARDLMYTISIEGIPDNKEAKNSRWSREIFSRLSCFYRLYRTTDSLTCDKRKKKKKAYYSGKKKRYTVKNQIMVNNHGYISHKANHKKERDMTTMFIRGIILLLPNKSLMWLIWHILM